MPLVPPLDLSRRLKKSIWSYCNRCNRLLYLPLENTAVGMMRSGLRSHVFKQCAARRDSNVRLSFAAAAAAVGDRL